MAFMVNSHVFGNRADEDHVTGPMCQRVLALIPEATVALVDQHSGPQQAAILGPLGLGHEPVFYCDVC